MSPVSSHGLARNRYLRRVHRLFDGGDVRVSGHEDALRARIVRPHDLEEGDAVHPRHAVVAQDHLGRQARAQLVERLARRAGGLDVEAVAREEPLERAQHGLLIVDDQDRVLLCAHCGWNRYP
jgi:hypothetical protein